MDVMRTAAAVLLAGLSLSACAHTDPPSGSTLDAHDLETARRVASRTAHDAGATITSATVRLRHGTIFDNNVGAPCASGRELRILLVGDFPHITTTGHPPVPGHPHPDFTVGAMVIYVDPVTGHPCLIGVRTLEDDPIIPAPGGTELFLDKPISPGPLSRYSGPR